MKLIVPIIFPRLILAALAAGFLLGCSRSQQNNDCFAENSHEAVGLPLSFQAFEDSLMGIQSPNDLNRFFGKHKSLGYLFFNRESYPDDSTFSRALYARFTNPSMDTLWQETRHQFKDGSELKAQLANGFMRMRTHYPSFTAPRIQTVITGLEQDLYVSDSLVIIGLDYFIGPSARYRPDMYEYILRRYQKDFIAPSIFLLMGIDERYNKTDPKDRTVLADMIAYGKAYYFAEKILACVPDSVLIGYSSKDILGSQTYSDLIWKRIIEDEVLYATDHLTKQKYLGERPRTVEVGAECPGRIGTWVGWQIVRAYMESHPDTSLPQLMAMSNASQLFKESGYRPKPTRE